METTKNGNTVKLVLPFPYYLWMYGMATNVSQNESGLHEPQAEQESANRENMNYEEEK